jgi:chromosome segregation protein
LIDWVQQGRLVPEGRVTLLRLDRLPTRRTGERIQLDGLRGVLGRADRLVRYEPVDEPLVRTLLGTTWFVESLATALDLSHFRGAGLRFVTAECQLIDSDGSITLGSLQTGLGLVSRRSEMQAAAEQRDAIQASLDNARSILESMENAQQAASEQVHQSDLAVVAAARNMASAEQKMNATRETLQAELHALQALRTEQFSKTEQRNQLDQSMILLDQERIELEEIESQMVSEVEQMVKDVRQQEAECRQAQQILVEHRIESARQEQRLDGLQVTLQQLLQDASERNHYLKTAQEQLQSLEEKLAEAIAKHDYLAIRIQDIERRSHELEQNRIDLNIEHETQQRLVHDTRKQIDQWTRQIEKIDDSHSAWTDEQERIALQRREILARYRDEYQIDLLAGGDTGSPSESSSREEIEAELARLRSEIASAGSVNMEALEELEELQTRYDKLANQEQDLLEAKAGLLRTMHKIDEDSRLVFRETLEAIRANFQQLYRKSFGGGSADIILENPDDPESGIEIVATPPGKTTFSNSLLSGGEKALTAVSLIMAFFQHRPSPFCILDEVDAPFDEANIGRFVAVLDEFLASTKFIIVTHSKKTMTVANMIYGVTMQESGVSRQVAVKFEEVDDRGEIVRRAA